jgi:hypothetical protein
VWGIKWGVYCKVRAVALNVYLWSSTGHHIGLMHACDTSMNLARAVPPALVLKMIEVESVGVTGQRNLSRALSNRGHSVMMWSTVWSEACLHWQPCGSGALGRCLALYSPVKVCLVSSHMAVQKVGRVNNSILAMNSGSLPNGRW